jgi:adenylate cyclase
LSLNLAGMALIAFLGWASFYFPFGSGLARLSYDLPFAIRSNISTPEIRLVVIDEKSARALNQPVDGPWDRRLHAQLIKTLTDARVKAILFDLTFDSPSTDDAVDKNFADAIRASGRVFIGAEMRRLPGREIAEEQILAPVLVLRRAAAGWGLLDFQPIDPDGGVRQIFAGTEQVPNVTWKIARYLGARLPEKPDTMQTRWLNYYAPAGMMAMVGYDEALRPAELAANFFGDRIVVVGGRQTVGNLSQQSDQHLTPYTRWGQPFASGMEIHATTLLNLLRGDWLQRLGPEGEGWLIIGFGIIVTALLSATCALGPFRAVAAAVTIAALVGVLACFLMWRQHIWFNWLVPVAVQIPAALFWAVGTNYTLEVRRRAAIRRAFSLYLSPHMADQIAQESFDLTPGGKLVEATMMFTDLKGFTTLSEQIQDPLVIAKVLITYFNNTTKHVLDNNGTIIKYVGDSVYATWGAPLSDNDHAYHAALAAWGMHQFSQLDVLGHHLVTRIGLNTGTVLAGNLGSDFRFDYTLIGDATNLASRLEGLNKYLGTQVLLTDFTWQRIADRFVARPIGKFVLMGKSEPVTLYELLGPSVTNVVQTQIESFTEGLDAFRAGDLAKARACMSRTLAKQGGADGPCEFYLREIARLETDGLPTDWSGAIVLDAK